MKKIIPKMPSLKMKQIVKKAKNGEMDKTILKMPSLKMKQIVKKAKNGKMDRTILKMPSLKMKPVPMLRVKVQVGTFSVIKKKAAKKYAIVR